MKFRTFILDEGTFTEVKDKWLKQHSPLNRKWFYWDPKTKTTREGPPEGDTLKRARQEAKQLEDQLNQMLAKFKKLREHIKDKEKKDIGYWAKQNYWQLSSYLDHLEWEIKERKLDKVKGKNVTKVFENDYALVVMPHTLEASCNYGAGTRWCTTTKPENSDQRNWFKTYYVPNKIYYIIVKDLSRAITTKYGVLVDRKTGDLWAIWDAQDAMIYDRQSAKTKEPLNNWHNILNKLKIPKEIFK